MIELDRFCEPCGRKLDGNGHVVVAFAAALDDAFDALEQGPAFCSWTCLIRFGRQLAAEEVDRD